MNTRPDEIAQINQADLHSGLIIIWVYLIHSGGYLIAGEIHERS
jgi:hypothetical protein